MHRHSPNRSQRSKGLKFKQVLQICVLVAVSFWLIYQFKHSFDKKKAFEERDANSILKTDSESMKFGGRKDLQDPSKGNTLTVEKKDEEETEEENGVEEDEAKHEVNGGEDDNKHEENAEEEDSKPEENGEEDESKSEEIEEDDVSKHGENGEEDDNKNERTEQEPEEDNNNEDKEDEDQRGGGDEEIDENEQEKTDIEIEVDALDEDRDKEAQKEDVSHVEDHDHEAREEQYKGDDASSAVTHDSESAETEREILQNHVDKTERNNLGDGTVAADSKVATIDQNSRGLAKEKSVITSVPIKEEDDKIVSTKQDEKADNQEAMGNDLTKKSINTNGMPMANSTETKQDGDQGKTYINPSVIVLSESNPTNTQKLEIVQGKSSNSSTTSETKVSEKLNTGANTDENQNETSDLEKETGEKKMEKRI